MRTIFKSGCIVTFKFHDYEIFAGSSLQVLRVGDFLCFTATNFCDKDRWVFFLGIIFCDV